MYNMYVSRLLIEITSIPYGKHFYTLIHSFITSVKSSIFNSTSFSFILFLSSTSQVDTLLYKIRLVYINTDS